MAAKPDPLPGGQLPPALSAFISETIEQWDPAATSDRIELYIGRDLQFIRINGTLVGGLVGIAIYLLWGLVA